MAGVAGVQRTPSQVHEHLESSFFHLLPFLELRVVICSDALEHHSAGSFTFIWVLAVQQHGDGQCRHEGFACIFRPCVARSFACPAQKVAGIPRTIRELTRQKTTATLLLQSFTGSIGSQPSAPLGPLHVSFSLPRRRAPSPCPAAPPQRTLRPERPSTLNPKPLSNQKQHHSPGFRRRAPAAFLLPAAGTFFGK